jgi:hypothetical protein
MTFITTDRMAIDGITTKGDTTMADMHTQEHQDEMMDEAIA